MRTIIFAVLLIVAGTSIAYAADPSLSTGDIDVMTRLWVGGNFIQLGGLALFAVLVALTKLDKKHAFYWSGAAAAMVMLVDGIRNGSAPSMSMVITAASTYLALAMRGPAKPPVPVASDTGN